jgi:hypothetical protein
VLGVGILDSAAFFKKKKTTIALTFRVVCGVSACSWIKDARMQRSGKIIPYTKIPGP